MRRDHLQISLLILSKFNTINFYSPWNYQKNFGVQKVFRSSQGGIEVNTVNIRSKTWRRSVKSKYQSNAYSIFVEKIHTQKLLNHTSVSKYSVLTLISSCIFFKALICLRSWFMSLTTSRLELSSFVRLLS